MKTKMMILSLLASTSAIASTAPILTCVIPEKDAKLKIVNARNGEIVIQETNTDGSDLNEYALAILGRVNLGWTQGDLAGKDPLLALVNPKETGESYAAISLIAEKGTKDHAITFSRRGGSLQGRCTEGPAFATFKKRAKATKLVPTQEYKDHMDSSLALSCSPVVAGDKGVSYSIRAFDSSYGRSSIQVVPSTDYFGANLDSFEVKGNNVFYKQGDGSVQYPPIPSETLFRLNMVPKTNSKGAKVYAAEYFDGKGSSAKLACKARWALQPNILKPVAESANMPKALPTPAGTAAQADRKLCANHEAFSKVMGQYSSLMMKLKPVMSVGQGWYSAEESPFGIECVKVSISLRSQSDIEPVRAIIGDSFKGYLVDYRAGGVIHAQ